MQRLLLFISLTGFITSCATTRVVKKRRGKSGVIMVQEGIFGDAHADAKAHMKANCGRKKPIVVEEGEAVVGTDTRGSKRKDVGIFGEEVSNSESRNITEWRIKYKCKGKKSRRKKS